MENLKLLRKQKNITMKQLGEIIGVSESAVSQYENGKRQPDQTTLIKIADYFNVPIDYILRTNTTTYNLNKSVMRIPVLGIVAAGIPIEAIENIIDYEEISSEQINPNFDYFGLKIKGDSMSPRIQDGDVVIVRKQSDVDSGDVAIVCVNGDSATCKQIKKHTEGISLIPYNTSHEVKFYSNQEIESLPISIIGKVVELRGKF